MSRKGKQYAADMADLVLLHSPALNKTAGMRTSLISEFAGHGEVLASIEKLLARNQRLLDELKASQARSDAIAEKAATALSRALEIDAMAYSAAEGTTHGGSRLVPFEARQIHSVNGSNGNGHGRQTEQ